MAIIKCKECGNEISDKASFCPHCGYKRKRKNGGGFGIASLVMGIVSAVYAMTSCVANYYSPKNIVYALIWTMLLCLLSIVFGLVSIKKNSASANSKFGIIAGVLSALLSVLFTVLF